ncbi:hypothetical protein JCM3770_001969 [Rhodotorula araucariae]
MPPPDDCALDDAVRTAVADVADDLRAASLSIHDNPEVGWNEHHAHDVLTDFMDKQEGFVVARHAHDLPTAWTATYTSPAVKQGAKDVPTVGFNSEMDALKGLGHACGHNLIAVAGCAAAVAVARTLARFALPGRVVLIGTPAEEDGAGKVRLLERGAYDNLDACLMVHPGGSGQGRHGLAIVTTRAMIGFSATLKGVSAHAGGAPEEGVNALDAAVVAYSAVSVLRQQLPKDVVVHGIIAGSENWSSNIIPGNAQLEYGIRAPSATTIASVLPRILNCFEGAAKAAGCQLSVERTHFYLNVRPSAPLARAVGEFAARAWPSNGDRDDSNGYDVQQGQSTGASTDFGNVSYTMPALHPMFLLPDAKAGTNPHSESFTPATALASSQDAAFRAASCIAAAGLRVLVSPSFRKEVREAWEANMREDREVKQAVKTVDELLPDPRRTQVRA